MSNQKPTFRHPLACGGIDYVAHDTVGGSRVRVEFAGHFEGRAVIWQATIIAMDRLTARPYIEIRTARDEAPNVEIGLPLDAVDEPAILKTIIMIRHYKNLRRGRHNYRGIAKSPPG